MNRLLTPMLGLALAVLMLAGCGRAGPARSITFGRVTYDGKPIPHGHIRFLIANQPTAQGQVTDGEYRIDFRGGVPVGTGKVEIIAHEETQQKIDLGVGKKGVLAHRQYLPAKYNDQSTLAAEVVKGQKNEINFDLAR